MNQNVLRLWIDALRSDAFMKGEGSLMQVVKDGTIKHCLLGVLVELYIQQYDDLDWAEAPAVSNENSTRYFNPRTRDGTVDSRGLLPDMVMSWAGLKDANPMIKVGYGIAVTATSLSDQSCLDLSSLADYLEETFSAS